MSIFDGFTKLSWPKWIRSDLFRKILWGFYLFLVVGIGAQLFFEDQVNALFVRILPANILGKQTEVLSQKTLTIAFALTPDSFEPTLFNAVDRSRLVDIYEGLVKTDQNLKIQPALALTWGLIDQNTWEFKLRPGLKFHSGKALTAEDVVFSIQRAINYKDSQLKNLLNSISEIKIINDHTIHILTKQPDPLLLNKLAVTFVFPKDTDNFKNPIGTGPYQFVSNQNDLLTLQRFNDYWGEKPYFAKVLEKTIASRSQRQTLLENGSVQLLADVPPSSTDNLVSSKIQLTSIPSLEVNFLIFNLTDPFFANLEVRQALSHAFDPEVLQMVLPDQWGNL